MQRPHVCVNLTDYWPQVYVYGLSKVVKYRSHVIVKYRSHVIVKYRSHVIVKYRSHVHKDQPCSGRLFD